MRTSHGRAPRQELLGASGMPPALQRLLGEDADLEALKDRHHGPGRDVQVSPARFLREDVLGSPGSFPPDCLQGGPDPGRMQATKSKEVRQRAKHRACTPSRTSRRCLCKDCWEGQADQASKSCRRRLIGTVHGRAEPPDRSSVRPCCTFTCWPWLSGGHASPRVS